MKHVTIIAIPKALGSTVSIPLEMLGAANDIARSRRQTEKLIRIEIIGADANIVELSGGLRIQCEKQLHQIVETDLVFVPGIWGNPRALLRKCGT